jgi:hypothetical protein
MGRLHTRRIIISAVALHTADVAVIRVEELPIDQNLFMRLQRSHGAASTLAGCLG